MKKVLAAAIALLLVLGAGLYFFVARPLLRPSEVTGVAERALATADLLLLAGINVKQAVFLEKWLPGSPRVTPVAAPPPPAVGDRSLLDHPRAARRDTPEGLAWWGGLAREDVASVGIPGLERLESGATQPFVKGGAKALAGEATAFGRVYLGLGVKTVPPQGVLRIVVDAKDAARGAEKIRAWEQAVNASRDRWKESMPSVAKLYDSIRVQTAGARSTVEFTADPTLSANSQRVIDELLAAAFGGLGVRVHPPGGEPPTERIDTEPVAFLPAGTPAALPPSDPPAQFAHEADQIPGP